MPKIAIVECILRIVHLELNTIQQWKLHSHRQDTMKLYLLMHIKEIDLPDETTTHTKLSYHCLVMSNIMITPLQFLYTSRNSASRATSSDYNTNKLIFKNNWRKIFC